MRFRHEPMVLSWLKVHYIVFSAIVFLPMAAWGLVSFGDYRAALGTGSFAAIYMFFWLRPGGLGDRIGKHQQKTLEERGELGVRPVWLLRSALVVGALVVMVYLVGSILS